MKNCSAQWMQRAECCHLWLPFKFIKAQHHSTSAASPRSLPRSQASMQGTDGSCSGSAWDADLLHHCLWVYAVPSLFLCCSELSHSPDSSGMSHHPAQQEDQSRGSKQEARMRLPGEGGQPSPGTAIHGLSSCCIMQDWRRGKKPIPSPTLLGSPFSYLIAQLLCKPNKTFLQILLVTAVTCPAWLQLAAKPPQKLPR